MALKRNYTYQFFGYFPVMIRKILENTIDFGGNGLEQRKYHLLENLHFKSF
jgi:hypothetical protein